MVLVLKIESVLSVFNILSIERIGRLLSRMSTRTTEGAAGKNMVQMGGQMVQPTVHAAVKVGQVGWRY